MAIVVEHRRAPKPGPRGGTAPSAAAAHGVEGAAAVRLDADQEAQPGHLPQLVHPGQARPPTPGTQSIERGFLPSVVL